MLENPHCERETELSDQADKVFGGDTNTTTVSQAKDWLRLRAGKRGAYCPCCKQYVKIYKRALGSQMARWLIWLVRTWENGQSSQHRSDKVAAQYGLEPSCDLRSWTWIDIRLSPVRGGDYAKLLHWDLVEQKTNGEGRDTRDSGLWRPTFKGIDFVHRRVAVPSHVYLYDNLKLKEENNLISITDALGKKFSYEELMHAPVNIEVPV